MKFLLLRVLFPLLVFLVLRSVLRSLFAPRTPATRSSAPPKAPAGGELKKDPVCGTYVSALSSPHEQSGSETVYFCSEECRQKFKAEAPIRP
jgi:YHS domain-containing protein